MCNTFLKHLLFFVFMALSLRGEESINRMAYLDMEISAQHFKSFRL